MVPSPKHVGTEYRSSQQQLYVRWIDKHIPFHPIENNSEKYKNSLRSKLVDALF
jgi:hypothetical protein